MRKLLVYGLLAGLLVSSYVGVAASRGHSGYPLDDAWIHQTYARNWAETGQLAYVVGLPSAGSTAPLWTLWLSIAYRLKIDPYLWSMLLGSVSLAICAWLVSRLADRLLPASRRSGVSWLAGLACVLEWHLIWAAASGMETPLFMALALALIDRVWARSSGWIIGLLGGLLILTRPEGVLLFALAMGVLFMRAGRGAVIESAKAALAFLIVLAPGAYFNLEAGGSIFPNTFYAKQGEYGELMSTLPIWLNSIGNMLVAPLAGGGLLLIPGAIMWMGRLVAQINNLRGEMSSCPTVAAILELNFPLLWIFAHVTVYALRLPVSYQHGRYLLPIIPIVLLYGVVGTSLLIDWLKTRRANPVVHLLRQVYLIVVVTLFVLYLPIGAAAFATDVAIINDEMVVVAQWLDRHTPPAALVAAHDIGAIGYFTRRPILDLAGLISPEVIPFIRDESRLGAWLRAKGAQYLVTFPGWYPQLSAAPDLVELFRGHSPFSPEHLTIYAFEP
ncbi:hypothetical protein TFLX_05086 [Thermoflexales bacterium]|nr:hypothetical protein TFLX_05086 [Thermoflexales bacterium]